MSGKNTQENYLDDLLSSVSGDKTPEELEMMSLRSQLQKMRNGDESLIDSTHRSEEQFLRNFESELEDEDYLSYVESFEKELEQDRDDIVRQDLDDMDYETLAGKKKQPQSAPEPEEMPEASSDGVTQIGADDLSAFGEIIGELNAEESGEETLADGEAAPETFGEAEPDLTEPDLSMAEDLPEGAEPISEGEEVDLAGNSGDDLMDLLAGTEGLEGIEELGDMLSGEGVEELGEDSIDEYAKQQMQQAQEGVGAEGETEKKPGLFKRIITMLFGPDQDEPEAGTQKQETGNENVDVSDENLMILEELEGEEAAPSTKKDKKEKKKKEKKEKPPKEKKEKKPKPQKPPKPKKEKPVDNTPPLPKVPVILILVMVGSMVAFVLLGTSTVGYTTSMKKAKKAYKKAEYVEAYQTLQGMSIREEDEPVFNRIAALAAVESEYRHYEVLRDGMQRAKRLEAVSVLDSLVCAAGRCNMNGELAKEYGCEKEMEAMKKKIAKEIEGQYKITFDEAVKIYQEREREDYSLALRKKMKELGIDAE